MSSSSNALLGDGPAKSDTVSQQHQNSPAAFSEPSKDPGSHPAPAERPQATTQNAADPTLPGKKRRPSAAAEWLGSQLDAKDAKRAAAKSGRRQPKAADQAASPSEAQHHTVDVADSGSPSKQEEGRDPDDDPRTPQDDLKDVLDDRSDRRKRKFKLCARISTVLLLILLVGAATIMVAVPAVADWRDDNSLKVGGAKLYKWLYLAAGMVASGILAHFLVPPLVSLATNNLLLMPSLVYVLRPLRNSMALTLHAAFCAILWWLIFGLTIDAIRQDVYITGKRILLTIFCFTVARLIKGIIGKIAAMRYHRDSYFASMKKALAKEFFLQALCNVPETPVEKTEKLFSSYLPFLSNDADDEGNDDEDEEDTDTPAERKAEEDEDSRDPEKVAKMEGYINKHKLTDTFNPNIVGADRSPKLLSEQAGVLTDHMWMNVQSQKERRTDFLERGDLEPFLPPRLAEQAFDLFDVKGNGRVSKEELQENVLLIFQERSNLQKTLHDSGSVVGKLETCIALIAYVIAAAVSLIIFRVDIFALFLTASSIIVAGSFVFGATLRRIFESFLWILDVHPFDVGDMILIGGDDMPHRIVRIQLLDTVMRKWNGERVYYPNPELMDKPLTNLSHSANRWEGFTILIDHSTPAEKIAKLRLECAEFLAANPQHFVVTKRATVRLRDTNHPLKVALTGKFTIRNNGADVGKTSNARDFYIDWFRCKITSMGITYHLPAVDKGVPLLVSGTMQETRNPDGVSKDDLKGSDKKATAIES